MKKRFNYKQCDSEWEGMKKLRQVEVLTGEKNIDERLTREYLRMQKQGVEFMIWEFFTPKAFSYLLSIFGDDERFDMKPADRLPALRATQNRIGKRLVRYTLSAEVWTRFVRKFNCTYTSIVHSSSIADCVCWFAAYGHGFIPMRSSEICCKNIAKMTNGGWVKMETWGKFFVDCLLKTAPYGVIEYTPKRWFPPICEKGDYFDPVLTDEEIAKHEQLSKQWKSEEERVSILLGLPLDVVNESPDGE